MRSFKFNEQTFEIAQDLDEVHFSEIYEKSWKKLIQPSDIIYDIGAFRGIMSLCFASLGKFVYAFEGSLRNYEQSDLNIGEEDNIYLLFMALSNEEKRVKSRFNDCNGDGNKEQLVFYYTLDGIIDKYNLELPDFVKMDIEGMESLVLLKAEKVFKNRPIWQLEYHPTSPAIGDFPGFVPKERGGFDFSEFIRNGYQCFDTNLNRKPTITAGIQFLIPEEKLPV